MSQWFVWNDELFKEVYIEASDAREALTKVAAQHGEQGEIVPGDNFFASKWALGGWLVYREQEINDSLIRGLRKENQP